MTSIIIPACGDGQRFGTDKPKHLVDIAGKPMVQRVIDALPPDVDVHLLVRLEWVDITRARIAYNKNLKVTPVRAYERGVCETLLSAPVFDMDKVLVINCDNVIVPPKGWHDFFVRYENAIVTFREYTSVEPPPFSYVRSSSSIVYAVAEKRRIGRLACAGAFLFADFGTLCLLCNWHMQNDPPDHNNEYYLAPVYSRLIESARVYSVQLSSDDLFVRMGTPLEAMEARNLACFMR